MLTRKTMFGGLAAAVLAVGGTAGAVAFAGPAAAAETSPVSVTANNCHYEPSGNPWKHVCLRGPHRYLSQCNMMRNDLINKGYGVLSCKWQTFSAGTGYYFWYGSN